MIYVGIDPGLLSGAWAAIDHHGAYVACQTIPHVDRRIAVRQWRDDMRQVMSGQDALIGLESVHSMPGQGVASTFAFGRAVGAIEGLLDLLPWPWHHLQPRVWKKAMGVTADKATSLTLARELWPTAPLKRQKDHGCAEALLMAEHMRRTWA